MKKSTKKELTKYLQISSKADLEAEIKMLYSSFKSVKKYYKNTLNPVETGNIDAYKSQIRKVYFPKKGIGKGQNNASTQIITNFKKTATQPKEIVDLLLYRTSVMMEFSNKTGDKDEAFYNSLTRSFDEACRIIAAERLEEKFKTPCENLLNEAYSVGWGVYDAMQYSYDQVM